VITAFPVLIPQITTRLWHGSMWSGVYCSLKAHTEQVSKGTLAMTQYLSPQAKHNLIKITEPVFGSVVVL
jgi:hypothetical protein